MKRFSVVRWVLLFVLLGHACKEGTSLAGAQFDPIPVPVSANQGCAGIPGVISQLQVPGFFSTAIGPMSQIVAAAGSETLYLTGADASICLLDVGGVFPPDETVLVAGGVIDAMLAAAMISPPITSPAVLSGIAILDDQNLLVVEQTSNSLLAVSRVTNDTVSFLVGLLSEVGGNSDGAGALVRFNFTGATQILAAGNGMVYVADTGNHSIRIISPIGITESDTIAGFGAPLFNDGPLFQTGFDSPTGLTVTCGGELIVSETGARAVGGHRIRSLSVGSEAFFGGFDGSSVTLVGNGVNATTDGPGAGASAAAPVSPVATADDVILWVDSATGILRRYDLMTGVADCPLFVDCATATAMGGNFTPNPDGNGGFSLAITDSNAVYVLDGNAGMLFRVIP
ncbi:MAG: hypothetical protein CMJ89_17295 [Planctomycetes bacterium]|jgi:hypothetical protein|nr:hypothetical protein [Planctomycetota bacterium]